MEPIPSGRSSPRTKPGPLEKESRSALCEGPAPLRILVFFLLLLSVAWADPWVVAHRGGAKLAPENSMQAFRDAIRLGVDAIELDVHLSSDGELVVNHDDTLDRTYGRPGVVREMTAAQLQQAGVPLLREVLALKGPVRWIVEIKHPKGSRFAGLEEKLVPMLRDDPDRYVVISFDRESVRRVGELAPEIETGLLFSKPIEDFEALKRDLKISFLGPNFRLVDAKFLEAAHRADLKVNAWTVNEEADMTRLKDMGLDAITTDRPDRLKELLKS